MSSLYHFPTEDSHFKECIELDNPKEWISLVHNYRDFAHQFKGTLKAPLLLHMAKQIEEYIY